MQKHDFKAHELAYRLVRLFVRVYNDDNDCTPLRILGRLEQATREIIDLEPRVQK